LARSVIYTSGNPPGERISAVGNNFIQEIHTGYNTAPNWDPVTGLGSPNAAALLPLLISLTS
jgi:hypothetical protein